MVNLRPCPNCNNINYKYGSKLLKDVFDNMTNINAKKVAVGASIHSPTAILSGTFEPLLKIFKSDVTPLLICERCGIFVAMCPSCKIFMSFGDTYPSSKYTYNCSDCSYQFMLSDRSLEFDEALNVNDACTKMQKGTINAIRTFERWLNKKN